MTNRIWIPPLLLLLLAAPAVRADEDADLAEDLKARRQKVLAAIGEEGVLVLRSRPPARFSNDVDYPFREDNDLHYLTGLNQPNTVLLMSGRPIGSLGHAVIFTATSRGAGSSLGNPLPTRAEVAAQSGLAEPAILGTQELEATFRKALGVRGKGSKLPAGRVLHYNTMQAAREGVAENDPVQAIAMELQKDRSSGRRVRPARRILAPLRTIKSPYEIACIRKAIHATAVGLDAAMRAIRPGQFEYEVDALITYHCRRLGCEGMAFPCIVGSGPNSCQPHYTLNRRCIENGELVVIDVGGDYRHYAADITRTVPANGEFTPRQRSVYELVLRAQEAAIEVVKPGAAAGEPDRVARRLLGEGLVALGLARNTREAMRYCPHGFSHPLGMDVHDVPVRTLAPGMVVTIEPGVYLREEDLGIRIEDDVLVTAQGREVLSSAVPKTVEAIEALMATGRGAESARR
ncbi:MAG: aminopeptidase P family protein [Planctomycetes bacterium]|nr:aminopeptidase P family protein [Planctomycetota bacterium]